MNRLIEVFYRNTEHTKHTKVTITKTRLTIKVTEGTSKDRIDQLLGVCLNIAYQYDTVLPEDRTLRGNAPDFFPDTGNITLKTGKCANFVSYTFNSAGDFVREYTKQLVVII